jgi:stage III sporulation protein AH
MDVLVVKRKSLVLGTLVVLLVITGYLNFIYNRNILDNKDASEVAGETSQEHDGTEILVKDDDSVESNNMDSVESKDEGNTISDASPVSSSSFFRDFRFERESTRKEEVEYIREIVNNPKSDPEMKKEAQAQLLDITKNMEKELGIEALIKAKGFQDALVILHENSVSVIIDKQDLKPEEVAQILDIVKRESGEKPENIKIIPKI